MIDTITLRLDETQFSVREYSAFSPDCSNFFHAPYARMGSRGYIDAYQNSTRKEQEAGIYKPQLTLRKRWQKGAPHIYLYVQFSAPKLLFHNNFDELQRGDYDSIIDELHQKLFDMFINTTRKDIETAQVVKIHYSKNIVLPEYVIPPMITNEIRKVDFDLRYDLDEKSFKNAGHSIRFHSNEFEVIFYDKKKDLERSRISDKRSVEKDNAIQMSLFEPISKIKPFDVLRMEVRLNTLQRIKREFNVPKDSDILLKELFTEEKCTQVLSKYWDDILESYKFLTCSIDDLERYFARFMINNPNTRLTNMLAAHSFIYSLKTMGTKKFRRFLEVRYSKRSWYGLKRTMARYNLYGDLPSYFDAVTKALSDYKPLHLADHIGLDAKTG